jgi:hypothetical protein
MTFRRRFAMKRLCLALATVAVIGGVVPRGLAQAPAAIVAADYGPALAREGDLVYFRRGDGARVALSYAALADADRKRVDDELAGAAGRGQAAVPPAADAMVRLLNVKPNGDVLSTTGIVFHVSGDLAYIYVMGALGDEPFGELSAVVPGRDAEKRIPVHLRTAFPFRFGSRTSGVGIVTGPRTELPEPPASDPTFEAPTPGKRVWVVADIKPSAARGTQAIQRMVMAGATDLAAPDLNSFRRSSVAPNVVRFPGAPPVYDALVLDEAGKGIGFVGWGDNKLLPSGERESVLTPHAFFASLKQGPTLGAGVTPLDGADGKPQLKIDFSLALLVDSPKSIVIKAATIPTGGDLDDAVGKLIVDLDTAPPPMIELGELKPSTEAEMGKLRGIGARFKPENTVVEYRSLTVTAPQAFVDGAPLLLVGYERDAAGKEQLRRSMIYPAVPKAYEEAQRAAAVARQAAAAAARQPPFSGNPRPVPVGTGAPLYDVNKAPKFLTPIPAAELK